MTLRLKWGPKTKLCHLHSNPDKWGKKTHGRGGRLGSVTWGGGRVHSDMSLVLLLIIEKKISSFSSAPFWHISVVWMWLMRDECCNYIYKIPPAHASFCWTGWNYPSGSNNNLPTAAGKHRKSQVKSASGLSAVSKIELIRILSVDPIIF